MNDGRRPGDDVTAVQEANLKRDVETWGTPRASDWKDGAHPGDAPTNGYLSRQVLRTPLAGRPSSSDDPTSHPRLNPLFVEWLMGWPEGWTSLAPIDCGSPETAWSRWWLRMRCELSRLTSG